MTTTAAQRERDRDELIRISFDRGLPWRIREIARQMLAADEEDRRARA